MKMNTYITVILLISFTVLVNTQDETNPCAGQSSCGACIAAGAHCGWCTQEWWFLKLPYVEDEGWEETHRDRCNLLKYLITEGGCDISSIINPENNITRPQNKAPKNKDKDGPPIQLSPQEINLKLRPNTPETFTVTFRLAEDYPVDLYYLMDLSNSMSDDKDKIASLGNIIADRMSNITRNFRLGFGSFVDKITMPYVSIVPEKLKAPCDKCAAPYGFKNQLPLTENTELFAGRVYDAPVSGNLDSPEGGFDAIMQAVACKDKIQWSDIARKILIFSTDASSHQAGDGKTKIGWRDQSRKMLILSTDSSFHYAGDGKLGGIVTPNDGKCHLDDSGEYTHSTELDYPSISQIRSKLSEEKVNLIFAVTKEQVPTYKELSDLIDGSTTGELAADSSNIIELIEQNYNKITSKVGLFTENAENITVKFRSKCRGNITRETSECEGLKIGETVTFDVTVEVHGCPQDPAMRNRTFYISPTALNETLKINVDLMCECECEQKGQEVVNASVCKHHGTLECGKCTCDSGHYGKFCECDGSNLDNEDYEADCRMGNDTRVCNGRGQCLCGECYCNTRSTRIDGVVQKYSGTFCECDDYSCDYYDKQMCGGPTRGQCKCGKCICNSGYKGAACDCPTSQDACIASNGELCNGKGECVCGTCQCDIKKNYRGPTCEDCPTCTGHCKDSRACVQCRAFKSGPLSTKECEKICPEVRMEDELIKAEGVKTCQYRDDDDCQFFFSYQYTAKNELEIIAQRTKVCPEPVNILWIVLGVIAGIVLVGLALLLIWKLLTTIHDRREFAKFEKERMNAKWDTGENPIYKQATSTFKNPTYAGKN